MPTEDSGYLLKRSLTTLSGSLFKLLAIDLLIVVKKSIGLLTASGLMLLFAFTIWAIINFALTEYLLAQNVNHLIIYSLLILLNTLGLVISRRFAQQQLNNIQFDYTIRAIEKIKENLGEQNENS